MNLDEYTQEVLQSTEKLEKVKVNGKLLINSLALFISAGRLLNQVKSKIDGNLYDGETVNKSYQTALQALHEINGTRLIGEDDSYEVDPNILRSMLAMSATNAEMCEALCNVMLHDHSFEITYNMLNEIGDITQHQSIIVDALDGDWDEVLKSSLTRLHHGL